jgi:transcriptional regulator with XRE-family HTH domain
MTQTMTPADGRVSSALDQIMRARKVSSVELGRRLDIDRKRIDKRRNGITPIAAGLLEQMADALRVPIFLFYETPDEIYRWFAIEAENGGRTLGETSRTWKSASRAVAA